MRLNGTFKFSHHDIELVKEAILYLQKTYPNYCSAEQLSDEVSFDIKKLQAGFKKITGFTIHQYQIHLRAEKAKVDLADSRLSIKYIASKNGFKDPSQFGKFFKKHTGQTPMEYRFTISGIHETS